jgi:hypothetical protein
LLDPLLPHWKNLCGVTWMIRFREAELLGEMLLRPRAGPAAGRGLRGLPAAVSLALFHV